MVRRPPVNHGPPPAPGAIAPRAAHWDATYGASGPTNVSWHQDAPSLSLELVDALGLAPDAPVIDVGGGTSTFVDHVLARGFEDVTVLDVSAVALDLARQRVGDTAPVAWVRSDVLTWRPARAYGLWHDRATFHFLTEPEDRTTYLEVLRAAVPDGAVILATFAPDGPDTCSGLPVARYGPDDLADLLEGFRIVERRRDVHVTPWGTEQPFTFVAARRVAP